MQVVVGKDDDGPGVQVIGDGVEVGQNDSGLLGGSASGEALQEEKRWLIRASLGKKSAEVGVGGDEDAALSVRYRW